MAVSLVKGQRISLAKTAGTTLTNVVMGLGWDARKEGGFSSGDGQQPEIDLDASCVLFDDNGGYLDVAYYGQLQSTDGSIQHTGDNRTGDGEGDDEQIAVALDRIPSSVKTLIFVVSSYTGATFEEIENAFCRIVDSATGKEIARYNLSCTGAHTALIMGKIYRHENDWKMQAIGESAHGRTFSDLGPAMIPHL